MHENDLSYIIRGAIFEVYNELGPGLLESVYVSALEYELTHKDLIVQTEVPIQVQYKGQLLKIGFRMDMLVEKKVLIEVKSIEKINPVHHKFVTTYLRLSGLKLGILVNFNTSEIHKSIVRIANGV